MLQQPDGETFKGPTRSTYRDTLASDGKVTPLVRMFIVGVCMNTTRSTAEEAAEFSGDTNNNVGVTSQPVSDRRETKWDIGVAIRFLTIRW